jgi:hypothetical protein
VKSIFHYLPLFLLPVFFLPLAHAQYGFDVGIGFGAMQDKASSNGLDYNTFASCTTATDSSCINTSSLSGVSMGISGNVMAWKHFGFGAEVNFQPGKSTYLNATSAAGFNLQSRMTLFDADAVYQPVRTKKVAFQISGGPGVANLKFYESGSTGAAIGSSNYSAYVGSNNHFQVHAGVGVQFYLTEHVFLRPQFDVHYVNNLTQFGSKLITSETVWLGYTFGGQ